MTYIELDDVPTGTWHAIATEDLKEFSTNHWRVYVQYLMQITSDAVLKAESIDFASMKVDPESKDSVRLVKEWTLCKPVEKRGDDGVREGIDQSIAFTHAASAAQKPIRTMMFHFFQRQIPTPEAFIVIEP